MLHGQRQHALGAGLQSLDVFRERALDGVQRAVVGENDIAIRRLAESGERHERDEEDDETFDHH